MTRAIHPKQPRRRPVVRLAVVALGTAAMLSQLAGLRASGPGGPVRLNASPAMVAGPHGVTSQVSAHDGKFWVGSSPINLRGINTVPLKNLDPGEYRVFAWEDLEPGDYMDPEFVKPLESQGEPVTIRDNSKESLKVKLISEPKSDVVR